MWIGSSPPDRADDGSTDNRNGFVNYLTDSHTTVIYDCQGAFHSLLKTLIQDILLEMHADDAHRLTELSTEPTSVFGSSAVLP